MPWLLLLFACGGPADEREDPVEEVSRPLDWQAEPEQEGLQIVLSEPGMEARPGGGTPRPQPTASRMQILDDDETAQLLSRLEPLEEEADDRQVFAKRASSPPPPLTGETLPVPFPPPPSDLAVPEDDPEAVEVLRWAPEGEIRMAPHLSLTFNQPMVAVTSHDEASKTVPLTLDPEPEGEWQWLGTKTLLFKPSLRLPQSTTYTATVPAGTESATGQTLEEDHTWTFTTPTLSVQSSWPNNGPHDLEPKLLATFDQDIDRDALFPFLELAGGGKTIDIVQMSDGEIAEDDTAKRWVENAPEDRWIAVRAAEPLPKATSYRLQLKKGAPSAEGPNVTPSNLSMQSFYTYHPLKIDESYCGWRNNTQPCDPNSNFVIEFNNPLDNEAFDPSTVTVTPETDGVTVGVSGRNLIVSGAKDARTTYVIEVPAEITDRFEQTLGKGAEHTFKTGKAQPTLYANGGEWVTLDPSGPPAFSIFHRNQKGVKTRIHKMTADDWPKVTTWWRDHHNDAYDNTPPPGKVMKAETLKTGDTEDELVETPLDLTDYLDGGHGQFLVKVEPQVRPDRWYRNEIVKWVQVTDMAITAVSDQNSLLVWVTEIATGDPVEGVEVALFPTDSTGTTDANGLAELPPPETSGGQQLIVAKKGEDTALLPRNASLWGSNAWYFSPPGTAYRHFTFDDRQMYRPGETVSVKGYVRQFGTGPDGDISGIPDSLDTVTWVLTGSRGNEIAKGESMLTEHGSYDIEVELPGTPNLGQAQFQILAGNYHYHQIQIQEFRRPEFEVGASAEPGHHILGEHVEATVSANYYSGGGLPNAPVNWNATATSASYSPPGHDEYTFGRFIPWWGWGGGWGRGGLWGSIGSGSRNVGSLQGSTNAAGDHVVDVHLKSLSPPVPTTLTLDARVTDVNRQAWTASTQFIVHPASVYVGLKSDKTFVEKGDEWTVEALVADLDGEIVEDTEISMTLIRSASGYKDGRWQTWTEDVDTCVQTSADEAVYCGFTPEQGGSYTLRAEIEDADGRPNRSEMTVYVAGGDKPPSRTVDKQQVQLIPDKKTYQPGDTAEILVIAPFAPSDALVTWRRSGLVHKEQVRIEGATTTLNVPIEEAHLPDLTVHVEVVGAVPRTDDKGEVLEDKPERPAWGTGSVTLEIPPLVRALDVEVTPAEAAIRPGGETDVTVKVTGPNGEPVSDAEVVLVAVDESVLALSNYTLTDPLDVFYAARGSGVSDVWQRTQLVLPDPTSVETVTAQAASNAGVLGALGDADGFMAGEELEGFGGLGTKGAGRGGGGASGYGAGIADLAAAAEPMAKSEERSRRRSASRPMAPGGSRDKNGGSSTPIAVRKDFSALALFEPTLGTGSDGTVTHTLTVPDNLTRYRLMAVAVSGEKMFGKGESAVTARNPLAIRPSPPRFLNFGDRFELPLVVQNQTDEPIEVQLGARMTNAVFLDALPAGPKSQVPAGKSSAGRAFTVPASDRVEVRIPAAADMAGTARMQIAVSTDDFADAAELSLPVWTPATSEAFAVYGDMADDDTFVQPIQAPKDAWTQFGGLEVTTSSTQLQALTDALIYLTTYKFECTEQISSRVMAIATLRDVLSAFQAEQLQDAETLESRVTEDLTMLSRRQNYDGGFPWWQKGHPSWPYLSVHNHHAISRAKLKGYEVPSQMWQRGNSYLQAIERHIPYWYSQYYRDSIIAYALYVRDLRGDNDVARARQLYRTAGNEGMSFEALGWLMTVLHEGGAANEVTQIRRFLENRVTETAGNAQFTTDWSDDGAHVFLHSSRRADAVILESLLTVDPDADLIPKVTRGLLAHRKRGRWGNTQENGLVLVAMDRYFEVYEKDEPDFTLKAWLGEGFAGAQEFRGRSTDRQHYEVPFGYLTEVDEQNLVLQKEGPGRLYYRIGLRYAPKDLTLEPSDHGFAVERVYEAIDDPDDVTFEDGIWRIKAGARVRVRLQMANQSRRYHVALVDPLPAGLEVLNPALAVTGPLPQDPNANQSSGRYWWWYRTWYEHENLRDERVEAFTSLLWDGVHEYTYVAQATTPGQFVVPPAKAEEMYAPETFGRSGSTWVVIE